MFKSINGILVVTLVASVMLISSCQEEEVAGIVSPEDNAVATIEALNTITAMTEGDDTLWYSITVDKMLKQDVKFSPVFVGESTVDLSDLVIIGGVLKASTSSVKLGIVMAPDELAESKEVFEMEISAKSDLSYNFQLNMDKSNVVISAGEVSDYDMNLDWNTVTYDLVEDGEVETLDMCELEVDFDILIEGANGSNYGGATGDCPETTDFRDLPVGSYDITIDFYGVGDDFPADVGLDIPYSVAIANNTGDVYQYEGSFNSNDAGNVSKVIGQLVMASDGSFSVTLAE
ncbi:hypothetical protein [Reichenbachiella sp. MSK19-1]|uniref:hypothetical protein n=1 Tax=Reichenbachiella sp. MSK19-1 TaxID=1897631 RepID=UPI000E6C4BDB|nr:hypothetical protein [Reichenbachiella sp. MSK19-1]RJE70663.1 hypothetical protein BGP76_11325 [Reichenbachiella sp. MSK19-1]